MDTIELAKFLNQISETETHFDNMSKKIQSIYERRAMQIMLFLMDNGFGSECTDQERLDYFSAGFCSGYKAGGVEEDWIDEAFCEYEIKRQERTVGAKNTEQQVQPDNGGMCTRPDVFDCHAKVGTGGRCMNIVPCPPLQVNQMLDGSMRSLPPTALD